MATIPANDDAPDVTIGCLHDDVTEIASWADLAAGIVTGVCNDCSRRMTRPPEGYWLPA